MNEWSCLGDTCSRRINVRPRIEIHGVPVFERPIEETYTTDRERMGSDRKIGEP